MRTALLLISNPTRLDAPGAISALLSYLAAASLEPVGPLPIGVICQ